MKLSSAQVTMIRQQIPSESGHIIVLVEVPVGSTINIKEAQENVYRVDVEYNIIWQISASPPVRQDDSFVYLKREGSTLRTDRFFGDEFKVDEKTGVATEIGWHK
jgi:hypothetical protein